MYEIKTESDLFIVSRLHGSIGITSCLLVLLHLPRHGSQLSHGREQHIQSNRSPTPCIHGMATAAAAIAAKNENRTVSLIFIGRQNGNNRLGKRAFFFIARVKEEIIMTCARALLSIGKKMIF